MSVYKIQTGNYPEESLQHSKQGESVKSRIRDPPEHAVAINSTNLILLLSCSRSRNNNTY